MKGSGYKFSGSGEDMKIAFAQVDFRRAVVTCCFLSGGYSSAVTLGMTFRGDSGLSFCDPRARMIWRIFK